MLQADPLLQVPPRMTRGRVIRPDGMSQQDRAALTEDLYAVHRRIFSGVSEEDFSRHVIAPPAQATWIQPFVSTSGQMIGYCAVHRYLRRLGPRAVIVLRAEAGLMPEYRGRGAIYGFGIVRAVTERLTHPFTPVYYLGTLVHPSSYHLFLKYFPTVFPDPSQKAQGDLAEKALALIETFPDPAADPADPFVRSVGWTTIETPQERALNGRRDRPDVAYFRKRNPGYPVGHGLVVLVPMTWGNLVAALLVRLRDHIVQATSRRPEPL